MEKITETGSVLKVANCNIIKSATASALAVVEDGRAAAMACASDAAWECDTISTGKAR